MMVWWPFSFFGFWIIFVWVIQIIVAVLIYFDAVKQGKNGLLWLFLVIIPWLGVLFLLMYLVVRGEEKDVKESCEYALNVANERYAKGEITREEFLQVKEDIKKIE
ncbi:MAG: SHOCT domain-containing protein [Candidatus Thermoplasmatota archaeon]|nr:SHOCT domain-containing protein [Candidatus Thermoplasmatota archaeon]MBU1941507.1 SHOCT domain-containing protein [Candidatus Thermoplasmatota archaeon]